MKNLAKILLCGLFVPVNMAFGNFDLYYDTNGVCSGESTSLWCANRPAERACCSGGNIVNDLGDKLSSHENRSGYIFRGWTTNNAGLITDHNGGKLNGLVVDKDNQLVGNVGANMTLYAAWVQECINPDYCNVEVSNDGTVSYTQTCPDGWLNSGSGSNITCSEPDPGQDIITIQYNPGEHGYITGNPMGSCSNGGTTNLQPGSILTPNDGWEFDGWESVSGHVYDGGQESVPCNNDISILTAQYVRSTHTITYDIGSYGTFASGYSATTTCEHGESYSLYLSGAVVVNDPTTTFNGWKYNGGSYRPGDNVTCDRDKTFVAEYTPKQQWVKFVLDNGDKGTVQSGNSQQYFWCQMNQSVTGCYGCYKNYSCSSEEFTGLSSMPFAEYFDYLGHYLTQGDRASSDAGQIINANAQLTDNWQDVEIPSNNQITIYAHWKQRTYTVTYDYSGCWGSESMPTSCSSNTTCNAGENYVLGTADIDCIGENYEFSGWDKGQPGVSRVCNGNITVNAYCLYQPKSVNSGIINLKGFTSSN